MFQVKFGKFISSLRNEKGLTQDELAEKLHVSSGKTISKWENGNTLPDFEMIMQLSTELDISLYELSVCEKVKSRYITKEDILRIVDKKHLKRIIRKRKLKLLALLIICLISLLSIIFTVTNFNTTHVYTLQSGKSEFEVLGSYSKTKDYSVFALTEIGYLGNDSKIRNTQVINYEYSLFCNDKKIYHNNQFKGIIDKQNIKIKNLIPEVNILIDSKTHNTKVINNTNNDLILTINYKDINDNTGTIKIPIKLVEMAKNDKLW